MIAALRRMGLVGDTETPSGEPMTGGVSSDIWRVDLASGPICVKCALAQLKVSAEWRVPVERNAYEYLWFETAGRIVPDAVPQLLGQDREAGMFAMAYLDARRYRSWKDELRQGHVELEAAQAVGARLAAIHDGTAGDETVRARFGTDALFHAIRLEPYLEATARAHPDRATALHALVDTTASTRLVLVHGDVSPKNILIGPQGPVFLDAECAWYGDPAFDLAFCLNHFLLKCLWTPRATSLFLQGFAAMAEAYGSGVTWEPRAQLEARTARLLPGLFLARVDGKSPVEYVTQERDKDRVRRVARALLTDPADALSDVARAWAEELNA